eukprot:CAMPEP_0184874530 /NCGR_PEP_ID=MMETSP0580-20130426/42450_1 /TAXON_ID=1118495 /ORGANISM="Dactyliosolen fragilissimus" /LENGTH=176 /DNA_ID=CAMNT_0027377561 /DNA_START=3172 /DNA_END=3702 /DNA_ORIENTATION=-
MKWWIDTSFGVHPDFKSQTGTRMSLGKGCFYSTSKKQKINTGSLTEAELVGVSYLMPMILWTRLFLEAQGIRTKDNIIYQDNTSTKLMATHGKTSCGKITRYMNIKYFFITDQIKQGTVKIHHCPTEDMVGDFFTKPLQGKNFYRFKNIIMGVDPPKQVLNSNNLSDPQEYVGNKK